MAAVSDKEIRKAIAKVIHDTLVTHISSDMKVRIHDHWRLKHDIGESANLLKVKEGPEKGKIHGWMIGLNGVTRVRPDVAIDSMGRARLKTVGANRRDLLRSYRVWCYYQLDDGDSDNNSENLLSSEIDAVADAFSLNPTLGITDPLFQGHHELSFRPIDTFAFGGIMANVAQGTLEVLVSRSLS